MAERLFLRLRQHYILMMMIVTRLFGSVGGLLVIYYIEIALWLPPIVRMHFRISSLVVVIFSCTLTACIALWETRTLREVLRKMQRGERVDSQRAERGCREAIVFVGRHHWMESWVVPLTTGFPVLTFLWIVDNASPTVMVNIGLAVFMGIAMALMSTYFAVEYFMQPVIRYLLDSGITVHYDRLPAGRLRFRMGLCSMLIIMVTALMIGTLAIQRASEISSVAAGQQQSVTNLRAHCICITIAAVCTGVAFSQVLGHSIASRVDRLVRAMENVAAGSLTERIQPTGTDEIDRLSRQFNVMVQRLEHNHHTIQDLNANLENKVRNRTRQLEVAMQELRDTQTRLTDVARRAGMAEIATGVLHNVGNVLNSVNVSTTCVIDHLRKSKLNGLTRMVEQLREQEHEIDAFLGSQNRGRKLYEYLQRLSSVLVSENEHLQKEMGSLTDKVQHIKGIITTQQHYARRVHYREQIDVIKLIEDLLRMHSQSIARYGIEVVRAFATEPIAFQEKSNLAQVFENLIKNAVEAMSVAQCPRRVLSISVEQPAAETVRVTVSDTGCGIDSQSLKGIFAYGFTTKPQGSGFGLHSSALAVSTIGGKIQAESDGVGLGARFIVEFPLTSTDTSDEESEEMQAATSYPVPALLENDPQSFTGDAAALMSDPRL